MSLNYEQLFQQMAAAPQVREATRAKAEEVREYMERRWPGIEDVSRQHRAFLRDDAGRIIKITESTRSNRPTHVVTVRHPQAVSRQARTGFATKAVNDVS